jgi:electron transport complex protein RnfC
MQELNTFPKGGVHPDDYKSLTSTVKISNAAVPAVACIPLNQHIGKPAECVVEVGNHVKEGMIVGKAQGFVSANIHSSIPGTVTEIKEFFLPNGVKTKAVVIELEGEFNQSGKSKKARDWEDQDAEKLNDIIAERGIVGLGGATFPTHVKYAINKKVRIQYLIINGVECEPFLTADHRLMLEKADEILEGIRIIQKIVSTKKVIIGIEANKPDAIELLSRKIKEKKLAFSVIPLEVKYPQGDEKILIKALLDREVPSGGLPLDIGTVVSNVGTVFAIYEAVVYAKPLIERVVTVTGTAIREPKNLKVRIGTQIADLIDECGGFSEPPAKLIAGGPMMGFALADLTMPVTKGMSGIIALTKKAISTFGNNPCIRCARCVKACPWGLSPTVLFKFIEHGEYEEAVARGLMDCKECGCCAYVCPSEIPLVQGFKLGKQMVQKMKGK